MNNSANVRAVKVRKVEAADHIARIEMLITRVTAQKESLINDQADKIVASPSYRKFSDVPDLVEQFSGALARQAEALQKAAEKKQKASPRQERGASAKRVLLKERYGYLIDPLGVNKR